MKVISTESAQSKMSNNTILLVSVTSVESESIIRMFESATGLQVQPTAINGFLFLFLGHVGKDDIYLALSQMGSGGISGSRETVGKAIEALQPQAVIMVGIAFGAKPDSQTIGTVLIADHLCLYESQRVGTDPSGEIALIGRGDRVSAAARLIAWLRVAELTWRRSPRNRSGSATNIGLILTGDKLVDNTAYRQRLLTLAPDAIGGEMEGAGLYVACQGAKVDWILVKAICDWADGRKSENKAELQLLAAENAASFVFHALDTCALPSPTPVFGASLFGSEPSFGTVRESGRSSLPTLPYFFGRNRELVIIAEAIALDARTWGVLIDGPGGIGKTALAIQAGHQASTAIFKKKVYLSAKTRELTSKGEQSLADFSATAFDALITDLGRELDIPSIERLEVRERVSLVRNALANTNALLILDNIETLTEKDQVRLFQFLSRLPPSCKAIVTSRQRSDLEARSVRLDKLSSEEALSLLNELSKSHVHLQGIGTNERLDLYSAAAGNPLLMRWLVGQLGRKESQCRTIADAIAYLKAGVYSNDPLEYVFGDLVKSFSSDETVVLGALSHFTQPADVRWVAVLAGLPEIDAKAVLIGLFERAITEADERFQRFWLPPLATTYLRRQLPEVVLETGGRLSERAYAFILENGFDNPDRFPHLEHNWSAVQAAMERWLAESDVEANNYLQGACVALNAFLHNSGRWDEWLEYSIRAEEKAVAVGDYHSAMKRAFAVGFVSSLRNQAPEVMGAVDRCQAHLNRSPVATVFEHAQIKRLRGYGYRLVGDLDQALEACQEGLELSRSIDPGGTSTANLLNDLAIVEGLLGFIDQSRVHYQEALSIMRHFGNMEGIAALESNLAEIAVIEREWELAEQLRRGTEISWSFCPSSRVGLNRVVPVRARPMWLQIDPVDFVGR